MKIVHAASEVFPYLKTGGLADVVGALSGIQADDGHEVAVFMPGYRAAMDRADAAGAERKLRLKIEMGDGYLAGDVLAFSPRANLTVYFICREEFFDRRNPYGTGERDYEDNGPRFIFFCKGVVETLRLLDMQADIVHGHDWQAALLPLLLRDAERKLAITLADKTVFTIHNIAYQGLFPASTFALTNLPDALNTIDGLEFYGQINLMKAGIVFADRVTTVSPNYAKEIQTPEYGCGLDGVVQTRAEDIVGLLNGVDTSIWNPAIDSLIPAKYSATDLTGKSLCRAALLAKCGFPPDFAGPVFGIVCRLVEQKGVELILANEEFFRRENCRFIILGAGERKYEVAFRAMRDRAPDKVFLNSQLDEAMSHLIEAGSDFFVMPSLFEPSGLNQMYSQVYGTVPIVSRVGGFVDTVVDADANPKTGTGIMCAPTAKGLGEALRRALRLYANKARYAAIQSRGMARDFGWRRAAAAYEELYREAL
ncbi:MAG: glycogen synthase GlgA [Opitutaceae bacterium]